ncbi:glycoside hydrolase family 127 protein [Aestuariimicrobium soli]|uniref:glycoside hydrolase family 127 protein n=1 Tax=Aestuariimicrobium soli TaxID=2035834 RepID=UPI003EB847B2
MSTPQPAPTPPLAPAVPLAARGGLRPLDLRSVRLDPAGLLGARQQLNGSATIPHLIAELERTGAIDNFRRLAGTKDVPYRGLLFSDSDVYKSIEAIAWEIGRTGAGEFDAWLDEVIGLMAAVQQPDGYLNTWIQGLHPDKKLQVLEWNHELYMLGHWVQAGIALDRATGRRDLLTLAEAFVALVWQTFGPGGERDGVCGHEEIETALVELYRHTGEPRHLTLAQHFIDQRGRGILDGGGMGQRYFQDHAPVREALDPTGHAVRQLYLNAGVTDVLLETGEQALADAMREQWERAHERKMYITGAFGSRHRDEAFGNDYELPSDRAYAETCASIADLQWTWRMMLASSTTPDPRHADVIERELHNAMPASLDDSGTRFFYSNPVQRRPDRFSEGSAPAERVSWYECPCCPPNIARLMAQLSSYVAAEGDGTLELFQFAACEIHVPAGLGSGVLRVETDYPRTGIVRLVVDGELTGAVGVRVPGWVTRGVVRSGGDERELTADERAAGRVELAADQVHGAEIEFDLTPRWTASHPRVDATRGCVALERGPIVYCVEQVDVPEAEVDDLRITVSSLVSEEDEVAGIAPALVVRAAVHADRGPLLRPASDVGETETDEGDRQIDVRLVPFASWGNRGPGAMRIWLPLA